MTVYLDLGNTYVGPQSQQSCSSPKDHEIRQGVEKF